MSQGIHINSCLEAYKFITIVNNTNEKILGDLNIHLLFHKNISRAERKYQDLYAIFIKLVKPVKMVVRIHYNMKVNPSDLIAHLLCHAWRAETHYSINHSNRKITQYWIIELLSTDFLVKISEILEENIPITCTSRFIYIKI